MEQFGEALEAYERAGELDPEDPFPLFEAGGIWWNTGHYEEARRIWATAIVLHVDHPLARKTYDFLSAQREVGADHGAEGTSEQAKPPRGSDDDEEGK